MKSMPHCPMYLTAGNFPSIAANTIQVAKMAAAYTRWLPGLEVVALTGLRSLRGSGKVDLNHMLGLSRPLNMRYLPLLWHRKEFAFGQDYTPPRWFYFLVAYYALFRNADLVFTRKAETAVTTVRAGIDTILELHDPWENLKWLHPYLKILLRPALRGIVVVASSLAESFVKAGIPSERILVESDGVDMSQYTPALDKASARKQLGLPENKFLCIYTGHLYRDRGIKIIIEAAGHLPMVQFIIVGGWEKDIAYYQGVANGVGAKNVTFTGFVSQTKVPVYQFAADLLLMQYSEKTRHSEHCSPLKVFEYLASGRPIISTDLKILHSVLQHDHNALLIESDSVTAQVTAIKRIMNSPLLENQLAKNARLDSVRYSWDERARRILNNALKQEF